MAAIARELKRHCSTIYREVERNATTHDGAYRPMFAIEKASGRRRRSRRRRRYTPEHFAAIERLLREDFSPQQVVGRLRLEGVQVMSHETIYLHIWADKADGGSLWRHLRGARKLKRKRYGAHDSRGRLAGKKMIEQRPAIVDRRSRLGDWERSTPCMAVANRRPSPCGLKVEVQFVWNREEQSAGDWIHSLPNVRDLPLRAPDYTWKADTLPELAVVSG
ncbi:MAG: IS30 family transposase [Opitutaceae bacterium]|nr:IS30 family transposase [Opitutaceae bacterium]